MCNRYIDCFTCWWKAAGCLLSPTLAAWNGVTLNTTAHVVAYSGFQQMSWYIWTISIKEYQWNRCPNVAALNSPRGYGIHHVILYTRRRKKWLFAYLLKIKMPNLWIVATTITIFIYLQKSFYPFSIWNLALENLEMRQCRRAYR